MPERRRRKGSRQPTSAGPSPDDALEINGWTIFAHPLFLDQIEKLIGGAEEERARATRPGPTANLLAHILDLAFAKIPRDPGAPEFRHGGTLGDDRRHWFRGKTGNGRYRLFYRFQSAARIIVYAWVNDEQSLRTYGSSTDAYAVFARMLDAGNPPDDWTDLEKAARSRSAIGRLRSAARRKGKP